MDDSPLIINVSGADFANQVLNKSNSVPVVADFWAAWCAPCRALTPLLTKLAGDYAGKFVLAKIDADAERALAAEQGIRSLPTVKIYRLGKVVDGFVGAQPQTVIESILNRHIARPSDRLLQQARAMHAAGRTEAALAALRDAMADDPANDQLNIELARLLLDGARLDEAERALGAVSVGRLGDAEVLALQTRLGLARIALGGPPVSELEQLLASDPENNEARYQLSAHQALAGEYEPAMAHLLTIVKRDRRFRDDAARKALVNLFKLLEPENALVKKYRAELYRVLN